MAYCLSILRKFHTQQSDGRDANSPAFGGGLTLFGRVSRSPALVPKSPAFYVHYQYRK